MLTYTAYLTQQQRDDIAFFQQDSAHASKLALGMLLAYLETGDIMFKRLAINHQEDAANAYFFVQSLRGY